MGFIGWIIMGLLAGVIVKAILPGRVGGGWITTLILGIIGAIVGGWIGNLIFDRNQLNFWSLGSWVLAIIGGLIVAGIWGTIKDKITKA